MLPENLRLGLQLAQMPQPTILTGDPTPPAREETSPAAPPDDLSQVITLLTEIRDLLKQRMPS